jgi:hypothetical protein
MNTHKSILVLFLLILMIIFNSNAYSQLDNMQFPNRVCGMNPQIPLTDTYQYPFFPLNNDTLHTFVVFCNFPSPSGDFDIPNTCLLQYWPGNNAQTMPSWADDVICPNTNNIWNPSLTGYFRDASMGRFYLTGDVYPELYVFQNQVSYYASSDKNRLRSKRIIATY